MTIKEKIMLIKGYKSFVKIRSIDLDNMTYTILIGDLQSNPIPFPIELQRELKINKILK